MLCNVYIVNNRCWLNHLNRAWPPYWYVPATTNNVYNCETYQYWNSSSTIISWKSCMLTKPIILFAHCNFNLPVLNYINVSHCTNSKSVLSMTPHGEKTSGRLKFWWGKRTHVNTSDPWSWWDISHVILMKIFYNLVCINTFTFLNTSTNCTTNIINALNQQLKSV